MKARANVRAASTGEGRRLRRALALMSERA